MKYGKKLIRPIIKANDKTGYINLSSNEAAYGAYLYYPNSYPVYEKLAEVKGVHVDNLLLTRGAEGGIKTVFECFLKKGDKIIRQEPTFGMLEVFENNYGIKATKILYDNTRKNNLADNIKRSHKLLYFSNPDNPTGLYEDNIYSFLEKSKKLNIIVLLDIVYMPYAYPKELFNSYEKRLIKQYDNLIIVNSFSKAHGLAGLRVGYLMADKKLIRLLREHRPINELNSVAIDETLKVLSDPTIYNNNISNVLKWKHVFKKAFSNRYIDTDTNFFFLKGDCEEIINWNMELIKNKILTRVYTEKGPMMDTLRISIGEEEAMIKVLSILKRII